MTDAALLVESGILPPFDLSRLGLDPAVIAMTPPVERIHSIRLGNWASSTMRPMGEKGSEGVVLRSPDGEFGRGRCAV